MWLETQKNEASTHSPLTQKNEASTHSPLYTQGSMDTPIATFTRSLRSLLAKLGATPISPWFMDVGT
jgi:hypothetical protein